MPGVDWLFRVWAVYVTSRETGTFLTPHQNIRRFPVAALRANMMYVGAWSVQYFSRLVGHYGCGILAETTNNNLHV